jgi:hypothetical protein
MIFLTSDFVSHFLAASELTELLISIWRKWEQIDKALKQKACKSRDLQAFGAL